MSVEEENGALVVVRRYPSNTAYCSGDPVPDRIVKEVYRAVDGRVALVKSVEGTHVPAKRVPERFEFPA